jgi:hypothetical protein
LSECEDFLSEFQLGQVRHVQTDHHGRRGAEPSPCRRPRNAAIGGSGPRCVERARVVGGRTAVKDGPWSCD